MTTGLDGLIFYSGASVSIDKLTFTRDTGDTIDYTNAVVSVDFYDSPSNTGSLLTLTSSSGSAFTNVTNAAAEQVFSLTLTSAHVTTLLNSKSTNNIGYRFLLTPVGARVANPPQSGGYTGQFTVKSPAFVAKNDY